MRPVVIFGVSALVILGMYIPRASADGLWRSGAADSSAILVVYGGVFHQDGITPWTQLDTIAVLNARTRVTVLAPIGESEPAKYETLFLDTEGGASAAFGDSLKLTLYHQAMELLPKVHRLGSSDIAEQRVAVNLIVVENPAAIAGPPGMQDPWILIHPNPSARETVVDLMLPMDGVGAAAAVSHATVFDPLGRRIREIDGLDLTASFRRFIWDGADEAGRPVSPGLYYVRAAAGMGTAAGAIIRLR